MKLILKNVRLAFPQLWEAKTVNGEGKPAFSCAFILPKDHPQIAEINKAIDTVAQEKWGAKAKDILKSARANDKVALHDGDKKAEYEGYEGNYFINARNAARPGVRAKDGKTPLTEADGVIYGGCYVVGIVELWAQDNNYGKRINASLSGVQFYKDGDAFAGGSVADDEDFADLSEEDEEASSLV